MYREMAKVAVILPPDSQDEERSVRYGLRLAEAFEENLTIIPVYDENKYSETVQREAMAGSKITKLEDVESELSGNTLEVVESTVSDTDVPWTVDVFIGELPAKLIEKLHSDEVNHVVVPAEQTSPTGKVLFGDIAQSLVLNTSIPTTVLTLES